MSSESFRATPACGRIFALFVMVFSDVQLLDARERSPKGTHLIVTGTSDGVDCGVMNRDRLCFVQFMHPGVEHEPDDHAGKRWNHKSHRRVFLRHTATLHDGRGPWTGDAHFWAEWEPEAELVTSFATPVPRGPRYAFRPYYSPKASPSRYQNTDPFVFGHRFLYTGCQQNTKRGPTGLRYLAPGSVVLFGSHLAGAFVLDTVFVVADYADHGLDNWRAVAVPRVSPEYVAITLEPWYAAPKQRSSVTSYRLYRGATPEEPIEGMFSFFPAAKAAESPNGFARPVIRIRDVITPSLKQGKRLNPQPDLATCAYLWRSVREQVLKAGLVPGVRAKMPPRRTGLAGGEPASEATC